MKIEHKENLFKVWVVVKHVEKRNVGQKIMDTKCAHAITRFGMLPWIVCSSLTNYNLVLCPKIKRSLYNLHLYFYFEQGHIIDRWWKFQVFFSFFEVVKKFEKTIKELNKLGDG
jgi:hypothetical protein